ncbi:ATP-binding cassette domain-containing protein [Priestia megaterium]|uniref:ATP-binding cassette domain-containing protein n=1 Tax=Priestia megaterium TaxID=1404 RepID=UPI002E141D32|nr:ATP-binding cassette domain-containing protein [Priestia megaterium]
MGDRGSRLSGGERQRLVLARAILKKPSILILDEATSALDIKNTETIQQVLDTVKRKMTILVVSHQLTTMRNAESTLILEKRT